MKLPLAIRVSLLSLVSGLSIPVSAASLQPNIVVIFADDLGYGDLTCYNSESQSNCHPHRDHQAQQRTSGLLARRTQGPWL
jgi:hypothetical protein